MGSAESKGAARGKTVVKPYTIIDCEQRTPEWRAARCGLVTSTCAAPMLSEGRKKGEEGVGRRDLRVRLVIEQMTGVPQEDDSRKPFWMERGVEKESDCRCAYEAKTGSIVRTTGFVRHNDLPIGSSLDGDIDDCVGLVEFKCPKSFTHLSYLRADKLPADYVLQVSHHFLVTGAEWLDFVSFDDRFPEPLQLWIKRVRRQDVDVAAYELALRLFLKEVKTELEAVQQLIAERAA